MCAESVSLCKPSQSSSSESSSGREISLDGYKINQLVLVLLFTEQQSYREPAIRQHQPQSTHNNSITNHKCEEDHSHHHPDQWDNESVTHRSDSGGSRRLNEGHWGGSLDDCLAVNAAFDILSAKRVKSKLFRSNIQMEFEENFVFLPDRYSNIHDFSFQIFF